MNETATIQPMTAEQLESIEQAHVGDYLGHDWTQDYVEGDGDELAYYRVATQDGTAVATMPDWAGGVALFLAEAHDAVPRLIAEIRRLRAENERFRGYIVDAGRIARDHATPAEDRIAELDEMFNG